MAAADLQNTTRIPARNLRVGMSLVVSRHTFAASRYGKPSNIDDVNTRSGTWVEVTCSNGKEYTFHVEEQVSVLTEEYDF